MIINTTPHEIKVGEVVYPRTFVDDRVLVVRAEQVNEPVGTVEGHPIYKTTYGKPYFCFEDGEPFTGTLPLPDEDVTFVVSMIALQAIHAAGGLEQFLPSDFVAPGKLIRDTLGRIIGTQGFSTI